ncbi:MAG: hypothetical protein ACREQX_04590 [Candidatus Binataceae bacterium]
MATCSECGREVRFGDAGTCPDCGGPLERGHRRDSDHRRREASAAKPVAAKSRARSCRACGKPWRASDGRFCSRCGEQMEMAPSARLLWIVLIFAVLALIGHAMK